MSQASIWNKLSQLSEFLKILSLPILGMYSIYDVITQILYAFELANQGHMAWFFVQFFFILFGLCLLIFAHFFGFFEYTREVTLRNHKHEQFILVAIMLICVLVMVPLVPAAQGVHSAMIFSYSLQERYGIRMGIGEYILKGIKLGTIAFVIHDVLNQYFGIIFKVYLYTLGINRSSLSVLIISVSCIYVWGGELWGIYGSIKQSRAKSSIKNYSMSAFLVILENVSSLLFFVIILHQWKLYFFILHLPFCILNVILMWLTGDKVDGSNDYERLKVLENKSALYGEVFASTYPYYFITAQYPSDMRKEHLHIAISRFIVLLYKFICVILLFVYTTNVNTEGYGTAGLVLNILCFSALFVHCIYKYCENPQNKRVYPEQTINESNNQVEL